MLLLAGIMGLVLYGAKHEAGHTGIFDRRIGGDALGGRQLMELLDALAVAIPVAPPPAPEVDAIALHALEQLPAPIVCAN